jgi:hypothetical protein
MIDHPLQVPTTFYSVLIHGGVIIRHGNGDTLDNDGGEQNDKISISNME